MHEQPLKNTKSPISTPKKYDDHLCHPNVGNTPPSPGAGTLALHVTGLCMLPRRENEDTTYVRTHDPNKSQNLLAFECNHREPIWNMPVCGCSLRSQQQPSAFGRYLEIFRNSNFFNAKWETPKWVLSYQGNGLFLKAAVYMNRVSCQPGSGRQPESTLLPSNAYNWLHVTRVNPSCRVSRLETVEKVWESTQKM